MTTDELSYDLNQVQEMVQTGIQKEMAAWCQVITDESSGPNPPLIHPPPASDNALRMPI